MTEENTLPTTDETTALAAAVAPETPAETPAEPTTEAAPEAAEAEAIAEPAAEAVAEPAAPAAPVTDPTDDIVPGMTVRVHQKIREFNSKGEEKERIQIFEGIVLARQHGTEAGATITVRKISDGVGVEKIFPTHSPNVVKIEPIKQATVHRAKLYFLRTWKKKLKEVVLKK